MWTRFGKRVHRGEVFLIRFGIRSGLGLGKACNAFVAGEEETQAALRGNSLRRSASLVCGRVELGATLLLLSVSGCYNG